MNKASRFSRSSAQRISNGSRLTRPVIWILLFLCFGTMLQAQDLKVFRNKKGWYGYKKGDKTVIDAQYNQAREFKEGLAAVGQKYTGKYGYIDETGKLVIPYKYTTAFGFSGGYAYVSLYIPYSGTKSYIINKAGEEVVPLGDLVLRSEFSHGLAPFNVGPLFGYINTKGIQVMPMELWYASEFENGLAQVAVEKGKYITIDTSFNVIEDGKIVGSIKKDPVPRIIQGYDRKFGASLGALTIIEPVLDSLSLFKGGYALAKKEGKYGVYDIQGRAVVPLKYDRIHTFPGDEPYAPGGLFLVEQNHKLGYLDKNGREVTPLQYDAADAFRNGLAGVRKGAKWYYIDTAGDAYDVCTGQTLETFQTPIGAIETYRHTSNKNFPGIGLRTPKKELLLFPFFDEVIFQKETILCTLGGATVAIEYKNLAPQKAAEMEIVEKQQMTCTFCDGEGIIYAGRANGTTKTENKQKVVTSYETKWNAKTRSYDGYRVQTTTSETTPVNTPGQSLTKDRCTDCDGKGYKRGPKNRFLFWNVSTFQYEKH